MAPHFIEKVMLRARKLLQPPLQESTSAPSTTSSTKPSQRSPPPTTRPIPQPTSFQLNSTDYSTLTLLSLQERLWNEAYDAFKASKVELVAQYEKILSAKLHEYDSSSVACESTGNEIGETPRTRCEQMLQLVRIGQDRTQKQASIKRGIDESLQTVQEIKRLVDKAVSTAPEAAVAWVGICLGLEILLNPVTEARENREGIAYVLARMEWYWNLVSMLLDENKAEESLAGVRVQLEKNIIQLYQKLLSYQIQTVCLYHRHWAAVIGRDMLKLDDWASQLGDIRKAEATVQRDMEQYNTEESKMRLQELTETSNAMAMKLQDIHSAIEGVHSAIETQTQHQDKRYQDDEMRQCLKDLRETDPRDDKTRIEATKGGLLRDSYRWILDHDDFRRWRDDPHSQRLWIKGDPGKGKTMLLCGIINELMRDRNNLVSYFFCQATEARLSNATAVLRGLIYLLVIQQPSLISHVRKKLSHAGKELFEDKNAWEASSKIFAAMLNDPSSDGAILIVDALDECGSNQHQLLDLIIKPSNVKWIVSSRNWPGIEEKLDKAKRKISLHLELNKDSVSNAVNAYIRFKVDQLAYRKNYDDETKDVIEHHLTSNANDTFLWVALVCQELQTTDNWDAQDVIREIPAGLEALYGRMLQYIQSLERQNPEMCRQILSTVVVAYRPLRLAELGLLSGLPARIQRFRDQVSKITSMCGSFLAIRDDTVYIIHQSAKEFLLSSPFLFPFGITNQHHTLFLRSLGALSETLRYNIYNLSAPGSLIGQVSIPDPDPLASIGYSCIFWADHLHDSDSQAQMSDGDPQDAKIIDEFLRNNYLYWLESLSLLRSMLEGVIAVQKLEAFARTKKARRLTELLEDARRFIDYYKKGIEIAPLQAYAAGLVFSPTRSLIREIFEEERPSWISSMPKMESDWNSCLQTLEGHDNHVNSVVFSADNQRLVSGSSDKTVKIWDATTGACLQTLRGHNDWVRSVVFSADGQHLVSSSHDKTIKIWGAATGTCLQTLDGHDDYVNSVVISADGQHLASGSHDKTVKIWDAITGACLRTLEGHGDRVRSVVFSADGQRLASGSHDNTIKIWDAGTGTCLQTLGGHGDRVRSVVFSADGQRLASGSHDNTIKIWDAGTGACSQTLEGHDHYVKSVVFSADGQRLASGSSDNTVKIWDTVTGACLQTLEGHGRWVISVVLSSDNQRLASGSDDKTIKIWDITDACSQTLRGRDTYVKLVTLSADGQRLASGSSDKTIKIWDIITGACLHTLEGHQNHAISVVFSADGRRLASGSSDETAKIWDVETGACLQTLEDHSDWVRSVMFSADGQYLASGSDDKTVKIWDTVTGACLQTLEDHSDWVMSVMYSADSQRLASGSNDKTVKVWDTVTGACLQTLEGHGDYLNLVVFSADGQRLASGSDDKTVKVWDTMTGACLQTLEGHDDWVWSVAFSADGQRLASGSDDKTIKIWDAVTGGCLQTFNVGRALHRLSFDPTTNSLLSTDIGVLNLDRPALLPAVNDQSTEVTLRNACHSGWGISADGIWIVKDEMKMLWLHPDYRGREGAVVGSRVAIGCGLGRVVVMTFS